MPTEITTRLNIVCWWPIVVILIICSYSSWAEASLSSTSPQVSACANVPHNDHPKAYLSNGILDLVIYLPAAKDGYYRASRFDWAGVIGCASYKGHSYFGEWFPKYDPLLNDSITGPVEEFRMSDSMSGYADAKPGDTFVKIGVGTLKKIDDAPYKYNFTYPLVDAGDRHITIKRRSITFSQLLHGSNGIGYLYTKTLSIDPHKPIITLEHQLKNISDTTLNTEVYEHDFYVLDKKQTGPEMQIKFNFRPTAVDSLGTSAVIEGKTLRFVSELQPGQHISTFLTGYSDKVSDYDFTVENGKTKVGVQQTSDSPISKFNLWSISTTICPEAFVHLSIPPKKSRHWSISYRFFADMN
jgi:hypothetical protein